MKLIVKSVFRDKVDHVTEYKPGTILDVKDKERASDLVERGLCADYKGKKAAAISLGGDAPEGAKSEDTSSETTGHSDAETETAGGNGAEKAGDSDTETTLNEETE